MKKTRNVSVALSALALGVTMVSLPGIVGAQGADKKPDMAQFARGAKEWRDNCSRCHNLRDPKEFTDSKWETIVSQMATRANLPGQVERDIKVFLKASN